MKIYNIGNWEYWYDRSTKCWWAGKFINGVQVGESLNSYRKKEIIEYIKMEYKELSQN